MTPELQQRLDEQDKKLDAIFVSTEKTRKYFLTIMWITIAMVVIPVLGLIIAIPQFIDNYTTSLDGLL